MKVQFVKVEKLLNHAHENELTIHLDGKCYWVKKNEYGWELKGRKTESTSIPFWSLKDGSFYEEYKDIEIDL